MILNEFAKECYEVAEKHGWYSPPKTAVETHMLIVTEIAEATEAVRQNKESFYFSSKGKPEGEAVELADAVIRIADYFYYKGWDLEHIVKCKMRYNQSRAFRHGNKIL